MPDDQQTQQGQQTQQEQPKVKPKPYLPSLLDKSDYDAAPDDLKAFYNQVDSIDGSPVQYSLTTPKKLKNALNVERESRGRANKAVKEILASLKDSGLELSVDYKDTVSESDEEHERFLTSFKSSAALEKAKNAALKTAVSEKGANPDAMSNAVNEAVKQERIRSSEVYTAKFKEQEAQIQQLKMQLEAEKAKMNKYLLKSAIRTHLMDAGLVVTLDDSSNLFNALLSDKTIIDTLQIDDNGRVIPHYHSTPEVMIACTPSDTDKNAHWSEYIDKHFKIRYPELVIERRQPAYNGLPSLNNLASQQSLAKADPKESLRAALADRIKKG